MNHDELQEHLRIKEAREARRHRDLIVATLAAPLLSRLSDSYHPDADQHVKEVVDRARRWANAIISGPL